VEQVATRVVCVGKDRDVGVHDHDSFLSLFFYFFQSIEREPSSISFWFS
jgi:hypothetical protein